MDPVECHRHLFFEIRTPGRGSNGTCRFSTHEHLKSAAIELFQKFLLPHLTTIPVVILDQKKSFFGVKIPPKMKNGIFALLGFSAQNERLLLAFGK